MWTPPVNEIAELTQGTIWLTQYSEGQTSFIVISQASSSSAEQSKIFPGT